MKRFWIAATLALALVCLGQAAWIGFLRTRSTRQESAGATAIERGRQVAERMGCFGCHGPGGSSPIPNPGARYGEVPAWSGGTWMLWSNDEGDLRDWILHGHPKHRSPDREALIPMPAYEDHLSPGQLEDLLAYVLAVSTFGQPEDPQVEHGREVAVRFGCHGCHGPEGRGLIWSPGSFRGYIPAWDSDDYDELVQSDDEFRQWVRQGMPDRLRDNPAARHLLETQPIRMPAYGERIDDEGLDALLAYVRWVRDHPRTPAPGN